MTRPLARSLVVALALAAAACTPPTPPASNDAYVLKAYDVPATQAQELRNVVSSLLYRGDNQPRGGNVVVSPTGTQLLVAAPQAFHDGMGGLAKDFARAPAASASTSIAIDYWVVRTGAAPAPADVVDDLPQDAKDAITKLAGGRAFGLFDRARLSSLTNERAELQRRELQYRQTASVHDHDVIADLIVDTRLGRIEVRATLPLDKPVVLAESGVAGPDGSATATSFIVVRASLAP